MNVRTAAYILTSYSEKSSGRVPGVARFLWSLLLFGGLLLQPTAVRADVTVEFVVDGSGSMWSKLYDQYKIVVLRNGIAKFLEDAPRDIRVGVRAFGLPQGEGCNNTDLLVAPALNVYQDVLQAIKRMNPTGQAPIIFSLRKGLKDLEGIAGKKVLILIADGSDSCEEDMTEAIEKFSKAISHEEVHVIGLGLTEEKDRSELKLLAAKANGSSYSVSNNTQLTRRIEAIVSRAIEEEEERLKQMAAEEARLALLAENTRFSVAFASNVPSFFCSGIRIVDLQIDGTAVNVANGGDVGCKDRVEIFNEPMPRGEHSVLLTYEKDNHGDVISSRAQTFKVHVEAGKTTLLECRTAGHLFFWGLDSKVEVLPSP